MFALCSPEFDGQSGARQSTADCRALWRPRQRGPAVQLKHCRPALAPRI
jgi:hypothetical protein